MKIIVVSDSHGHTELLRRAISSHPDAMIVIHLGDCENDLLQCSQALYGKYAYEVKGNCYSFGSAPLCSIPSFHSVKLYCCHGHIEKVKSALSLLKMRARAEGCKIALYGHTHISYAEEDDGLLVFNPGAIKNGEYGIIAIDEIGNISYNHLSVL